MAQKVQIILEDDIDGSEAVETMTFALDGTTYEIDLNESNATALREALATYVGHGRRLTGPRRGGRQRQVGSAANFSHGAREIRDWARSNGHSVPQRGRIPAEVREAFEAAH